MKINIVKLHKDAVIPSYAKDGDAGLDLTVTEVDYEDNEHVKVKFGIAVEIPLGFVGLIFPRSSIYKKRQILSNSVGVIDSGYRGEICAVFIGTARGGYNIGERAAQLIIIPYPEIEFNEVKQLTETERGDGGFGSTNK